MAVTRVRAKWEGRRGSRGDEGGMAEPVTSLRQIDEGQCYSFLVLVQHGSK